MQVAAEEGVPGIDLTTVTEEYLRMVGDFPSRALYVFPKDNTHLVMQGAVVFAGFIANGLLELGSPYSDLLVDRMAAGVDDDQDPAVNPYYRTDCISSDEKTGM